MGTRSRSGTRNRSVNSSYFDKYPTDWVKSEGGAACTDFPKFPCVLLASSTLVERYSLMDYLACYPTTTHLRAHFNPLCSQPHQTANLFLLPCASQLANLHLLECHIGTTLKSAHLPTPLISGHFPVQYPSSNSSNSMFNMKQGSTLRTKSREAMAFFPWASETSTRVVFAASKAGAKRERAARESGSEVRCECRGAEKESRMERRAVGERDVGDGSECR